MEEDMAKSGPGRSRDAPQEKPKPEDFNHYNIDKKVRQDCLEHPATIYPVVGGVIGVVACIAVLANPVTVAATLGAFFVGGASYIWNYYVRGDELREKHRLKLLALKREHEKALMGDLVQDAQKLGFADGARIASAFHTAYGNLLRYVEDNDGPGMERYRMLAEQANREAYDQMQAAIDLFKALQSVDMVGNERELRRLRGIKNPDRATRTKIESLEEMLEAFNDSRQHLSELLAGMSGVEAVMQKAYLQMVGIGAHEPGETQEGAAGELQLALEAASKLANAETDKLHKRDEYAQHGREVADREQPARLNAVEAARQAEQRLLGAADADKASGQTDRASRVE
jgi:hypothetical protein